MTETETRPLPLDAWHRARGARMVPFAGYAMPIQYEGIVAEHNWTRGHAGLFDVSHMGQLILSGEGAMAALERLLPADLQALKPGRVRYSLLLAEDGGILDDLMVTNIGGPDREAFYLVVNGATKYDDIEHIRAYLPIGIAFEHLIDSALLALQGPEAVSALERLLPGLGGEIAFMQETTREWQGHQLRVTRSGYTGEDGCEISLPDAIVADFADALLADERVRPIGLGARDSLRLEAGLPLYGHDLTTATDPVSAGLTFALSRRRREEGGFPGADRIGELMQDGPPTKRVGLSLEGRLPAREGATVVVAGNSVGKVTSGGFSPTLGRPIAMAQIDSKYASPGTRLGIEVRGRVIDAEVVSMPFVPHRYHRAGARK